MFENTEQAIYLGQIANLGFLTDIKSIKAKYGKLARKLMAENKLDEAMEAATQRQFCRECLEASGMVIN